MQPVVDNVISWMLSNFTDLIYDLINGILDFFNNFVNNIFFYVAEVNLSNRLVINAATYTTLLGIALITLIGVKQYFTTYVMETNGDPDSDPLDILVRCSEAVAICSSNDFITTYFFRFSKAFATDLGEAGGVIDLKPTISDLTATIARTPSSFIFLLIILLLVIGILVFSIIAGIRGAELSLMKIMLPIMSVDLVTANRERWGNFFISYAVTFLYYGLQLLCYRMFIASLMTVSVSVMSNELLITFGWFFLMLRGPKWLEKFIYSSGFGRGVAEAGRTAVSMLPNLMKSVK
ncbi:conjugal transfer protein TrbL family protein [Lacrimispora amygdalina]|uniref:conjugal transfer protein TrbL family protein n=1 Tax=Lacrimispora amygdalina TaxID=253257 RepID=UPI000BE3C393|nr:conjugal transfer protein TrbL family protein [Lacrimispora amygdalina]